MTSKLYFISTQLGKFRFICFVWEILFIWTMWQILFFVAVKTCCIYLGSHPYKEDYQVSRISHKGCQGHIYQALLQSFRVFQHWRRIIEWTSCKISQATKRSLDWFLHDVKKNLSAYNHLLAFWRQHHVRDLMFQFRLLKCFPLQRKFAKNAQYKSWDSSGVRA